MAAHLEGYPIDMTELLSLTDIIAVAHVLYSLDEVSSHRTTTNKFRKKHESAEESVIV